MPDMLEFFNLELLGTHHRGIDDCVNLANIAIEMLKRGWIPATIGEKDRRET